MIWSDAGQWSVSSSPRRSLRRSLRSLRRSLRRPVGEQPRRRVRLASIRVDVPVAQPQPKPVDRQGCTGPKSRTATSSLVFVWMATALWRTPNNGVTASTHRNWNTCTRPVMRMCGSHCSRGSGRSDRSHTAARGSISMRGGIADRCSGKIHDGGRMAARILNVSEGRTRSGRAVGPHSE
jgi:hypothetical protein